MSFKPIDSSKEDFKNYLNKHGVLEALTKVLSKVQEQKPDDPLAFINSCLSSTLFQQENIKQLEEQLTIANQTIGRLSKEAERLKQTQRSGGCKDH